MSVFHIHTHRSHVPRLIDITAADLEEVGKRLARDRFLTGILLAEGDALLDAPVEVLIPAQTIALVVARS